MGQLVFQATLGGQVNLIGPNTASTFNINVPATAGTIVTTGDSGSVTSTMISGPVSEAKGGTGTTTGYYGFKNRIINGAMVINQRGFSGNAVDNTYTLDRFVPYISQSAKFTIAQSSTAATGFSNSLLATSLSAYAVLVGDYFVFSQQLEGYNVADLAFGTASAATVTLSFWVRSSLTGTFGGALKNLGTSATRSYPFTYTINAANTFEQKTITIAGDTSGTWATTNGTGMCVNFGLGVGATFSGTAGAWAGANYLSATGATSVVGTNGATFYITGVQLEKGSTATSFDYRPYGTELALCQRYLYAFNGINNWANGACYSTTQAFIQIPIPVQSRIPFTGITVSSVSQFEISRANSALDALTVCSFNSSGYNAVNLNVTIGSAVLVAGNATSFHSNNANSQLLFTGAEL